MPGAAQKLLLLYPGAGSYSILDVFAEGDEGDLWLPKNIDAEPDSLVASWTGERGTVLAQSVDGRKPTLKASGRKRWLQFDIDDLDDADVLGDCLLAELEISTAALTIIVAAHNEDPNEADEHATHNRRCVQFYRTDPNQGDVNINFNLPRFVEQTIDRVGEAEAFGFYGGLGYRNPQNNPVISTPAANAALGTPGVASYQRNGTAIQDGWIDGESLARITGTTTTFTSQHLAIGSGVPNTDGQGHWIGKIYGAFAIDRVLTANERIAAEAFMRGLIPEA